MALTDPRSVIREILSRRPDLHAAFAPQLSAAGIQVAGPGFSGETRRRLDAANNPFSPTIAGMPPTPPPTGFPAAPQGLGGLTAQESAIPFNGTGGDPNSLRSMADRGDPSQAPDFRSRLTDARMLQGSARVPPGSGLVAAGTNPTAQVQGQLPANFMSPGNIPRTRPPEQLSAAGPPSPLTGANSPSPLAGAGPPAPIIGREAPPGLNGPPSPLASRFGDQSQLPGGAFSGSFPKPPQPRPFESMIAARPEGPPGGFPAARPSMAQGPMPGSETMGPPSPLASRFGDQSQLAGGAFSGGAPPPPIARGPTPLQIDAAKDMVRQMASLPSVPPPSPLTPLETTPTSTMPNPLQRAPLNLAAGAGLSGPPPPLGSTSMPFATSASFGSVGQRMTDAGLPPGLRPVRSTQAPLISVPPAAGTAPVGAVTSQPLPPPDKLSSIPPASMQALSAYTGNEAPIAGQATPAPTIPSTRAVRAIRNAITGDNKQPVAPVAPVNEPAPPPAQGLGLKAPGYGTIAGAVIGAGLGGWGGAAAGAGGGRVIGKIVQAIRNRGQTVDAQGNIIDKAGNVIGHVSDMLGKAGSGLGGIFGGGGSASSGGMGMGGWGGPGGWGGGSSYTGGNYGGNAGYNIREGVGQRFGQR